MTTEKKSAMTTTTTTTTTGVNIKTFAIVRLKHILAQEIVCFLRLH